MSTWVITSWVFVAILTGVNIFVFLKLKGASEQMLKMAFPNANRRLAQTAIDWVVRRSIFRWQIIEATEMKLLSTLLVLAVVSTAGAAAALTYNTPDNAHGADTPICTLSGYMMYCN